MLKAAYALVSFYIEDFSQFYSSSADLLILFSTMFNMTDWSFYIKFTSQCLCNEYVGTTSLCLPDINFLIDKKDIDRLI